jgi:hypothetical protein
VALCKHSQYLQGNSLVQANATHLCCGWLRCLQTLLVTRAWFVLQSCNISVGLFRLLWMQEVVQEGEWAVLFFFFASYALSSVIMFIKPQMAEVGATAYDNMMCKHGCRRGMCRLHEMVWSVLSVVTW